MIKENKLEKALLKLVKGAYMDGYIQGYEDEDKLEGISTLEEKYLESDAYATVKEIVKKI